MSIQLSHSAIECYNTCSKKYEYQYIQRYRSKTVSSALFFGGLFGESVQLLCLEKMEEKDRKESDIAVLEFANDNKLDVYGFFKQKMEKIEINDIEYDLSTCPHIRYYKSDFDESLLCDADLTIIKQFVKDNNFFFVGTKTPISFNDLKGAYFANQLDEDEYSFMNLHFWLSLRRKGCMMIESYQKEVLPNIIKVHAIEKPIELYCGEDNLIGFIDLICDYKLDKENAERIDMKENDIVTVIFDHKTASARYTKNKLQKDCQQLSIYDYSEQVGIVGYIVAVKKLKEPKTGPRKGEKYVDIQVLIDKIPDEIKESYIDKASIVLNKINNKEFNIDKNSCKTFGRLCDFYLMCQEGKSDDYLHKKEKR